MTTPETQALIQRLREHLQQADYRMSRGKACKFCGKGYLSAAHDPSCVYVAVADAASALSASPATSAEAPALDRQWVIDNIYTIARRESRREQSKLRPEMWAHVIRLCERTGAHTRTVGILRSEDATAEAPRQPCISACAEKAKLGIQHGLCATCAAEAQDTERGYTARDYTTDEVCQRCGYVRPCPVHDPARLDAVELAIADETAKQLTSALAESEQARQQLREALVYHGAHQAHCKATGVVERKLWMGTTNEWTLCDCGLADVLRGSAAPHVYLIQLNPEQEQAAKDWAADDRLWTTQETVETNLRTFARVILKAAVYDAAESSIQRIRDLTEEGACVCGHDRTQHYYQPTTECHAPECRCQRFWAPAEAPDAERARLEDSSKDTHYMRVAVAAWEKAQDDIAKLQVEIRTLKNAAVSATERAEKSEAALAESEQARQQLREALERVLGSAHPQDWDHPVMFAAWTAARAVLDASTRAPTP